MTVNEKLFRQVIKAIEAKPTTWKQSHWALINDAAKDKLIALDDGGSGYKTLPEGVTCGTSMCLAGQTVSQAGFPLLWWPGARAADWCLDPATKGQFSISEKAQELLGLSTSQANRVFHQNAAKPGVIDLEATGTSELAYLESTGPDDIEVFKERITAWTGVTFPKESEPVAVRALRLADDVNGAVRVNLKGLARAEDDHYLAAVDEHGVITLAPAVLVPTPKEK